MTARSVLLVLALVAIPLGAHAGPAKVAVAKVKGSKKANPAGFESGLVKGLKAAGVTTIGVAAVRPGTPSFTAPAEEAGAVLVRQLARAHQLVCRGAMAD